MSFLTGKTNLPRCSRSFGISASQRQEETTSNYSEEKTYSIAVELWAHPPVLSHGTKNLLIDCGDDLLSSDLLLLSWRSSAHSDDASSPDWELSVSARAPFMPSTSVSRFTVSWMVMSSLALLLWRSSHSDDAWSLERW